MVEPCASIGRELVRRAYEMKECRRVSLILGEICERAELLYLILRARHNECEHMLRPGGRHVEHASQEVAYELTRPLVALYEIRLATHSDCEHERRLRLVGARCSDDQVVDSVVWGL